MGLKTSSMKLLRATLLRVALVAADREKSVGRGQGSPFRRERARVHASAHRLQRACALPSLRLAQEWDADVAAHLDRLAVDDLDLHAVGAAVARVVDITA